MYVKDETMLEEMRRENGKHDQLYCIMTQQEKKSFLLISFRETHQALFSVFVQRCQILIDIELALLRRAVVPKNFFSLVSWLNLGYSFSTERLDNTT